jgi:hypothetical protein
MTASAKRKLSEADIWQMPGSLRRMSARDDDRPALDAAWPCLQQDQWAPADLIEELSAFCAGLEGCQTAPAPFDAPGEAFALAPELARGQPEAFLNDPVWANLRPDGALHLGLKPEWAQKVIDKGWATIHPFARYMAGAVPPQSLLVFAPRSRRELKVIKRIAEAAHGYAMGRIEGVILPDTRW